MAMAGPLKRAFLKVCQIGTEIASVVSLACWLSNEIAYEHIDAAIREDERRSYQKVHPDPLPPVSEDPPPPPPVETCSK